MSANNNRLISRIPAVELFPVVEYSTLPAKATEFEAFPIRATVFREGHDQFAAEAVLLTPEGKEHSRARMYDILPGRSRFEAWVMPDRPGAWTFRVDTWSDPWATWKQDAELKIKAGVDAELMCEEGARVLERALTGKIRTAPRPPRMPAYKRVKPTAAAAKKLQSAIETLRKTDTTPLSRFVAATSPAVEQVMERYPLRDLIEATAKFPLQVDRRAALYGSWYEIFPRSIGAEKREDGTWVSGTLRTAIEDIPRIADMGFTVLYLTPVHPIGTTFRKGRNNATEAVEGDPGSPYGIGSPEGGHDAINSDLGDFEDFDALVAAAADAGMEVAMDLALQASPDHPWVQEHPEWFSERADGSIAYAENPPKKYQDIYPLNFDNDPEGIYKAIIAVVEKWISHGVRIFRVDNPHTKPLTFWERFLRYMNKTHPGVLFLAEAFTKPAMMRTLGMIGFQQSYTYFAWRVDKEEIEDYLVELSNETAHVLRPAFWPTTHDILTPQMTTGGTAVFALRAMLAATGSPTWGIYTGYELVENVQRPGSEEQIDNEKYEYRPRDWEQAELYGITNLLTKLNQARAKHPALQQLHQLSLLSTSSDKILAFSKHVPKRFSPTGEDDTMIVVISLDPHHEVGGEVYIGADWLWAPDTNNPQSPAYDRVGKSFRLNMVDELDGREYVWTPANYVKFSPWERMGHVFWVKSFTIED